MNQIDGVCQTIEKTINQAVQKTLDQLEKDSDLICSTISSRLEQDRFESSFYSAKALIFTLICHEMWHLNKPYKRRMLLASDIIGCG